MNRLLILLLISLFGCAAPPKLVTLSEVTRSPELYKNVSVQFAGLVKENNLVESSLSRWELLVTDGQTELYCFKAGYNRSLLSRGARLAEEAKGEEGTVTVTGRLVSLHGIKTGPNLEVQRLSYKGKSVDVETADYPVYYYYGPRYPHYFRTLPHRHHGSHRGR